METFQKLKLLLSDKEEDLFFKKLTYIIQNSNWKIREDLTNNYKNNSFSLNNNILCLESEEYNFNYKNIKGLVWFGNPHGYYEVVNIIPIENKNLSKKEYNFILNEFYQKFIKELANDFKIEVILTSPEKAIIDTIGDEALSALISFSLNANKYTGNTNTYDFERWCEFIFIIFRREIELNSTELEKWLLENGWGDEMASKLAIDYEYSIDLLEKYEQN